PELAVGSVGNVHRILLATHVRLLIVLDAANGEAEEIIELAHPLRVAASQIIIDRNQMRAATSQRIEIKWQCRHERLAFARRDLRDPPSVQDDSAEQLHVEVHHVPNHRLIADGETMLPVARSEEHTSELQS